MFTTEDTEYTEYTEKICKTDKIFESRDIVEFSTSPGGSAGQRNRGKSVAIPPRLDAGQSEVRKSGEGMKKDTGALV